MSEQYPYHRPEEYIEPRHPGDLIAEELKFYPDGASFFQNIYGLTKMYEKTPLMKSFQKYSYLMNVVKVRNGSEGSSAKIDEDFSFGTIFATHVMLRLCTPTYRRIILKIDSMQEIQGEEADLEQRKIIMDNLEEWDNRYCQEVYEYQEDIMQEKVMEAALLLYENIDNSAAKEDAFISGFIFAADRICDYIDIVHTTNPV